MHIFPVIMTSLTTVDTGNTGIIVVMHSNIVVFQLILVRVIILVIVVILVVLDYWSLPVVYKYYDFYLHILKGLNHCACISY